ncbi:hypothetical protein LARI1_G007112 [Lachnellula arida]|uniref:F-box domain-containing protein n=1 Tax=Lachnellula arida TaxID=1316785 RepID=A0A8T9B4S1_9HELO|nr:hypothetical protein LARI1_G007112 [Lachnellula arida]
MDLAMDIQAFKRYSDSLEAAALDLTGHTRASLIPRFVREQKRLELMLRKAFSDDSNLENNFYRLLTHDDCESRHQIIEPEMLELNCPLDNGRHNSPNLQVNQNSWGLFRLLPLEVLHNILQDELDLHQLTKVRSVSRGLRSTVDALPYYSTVINHSPSVLRALLALETASSVTCHMLYNWLCVPNCPRCGKFGAFFDLILCRRICYECFLTAPHCFPVDLRYAQTLAVVTAKDITNIGGVIARSVPGYYTWRKTPERKRHRLVNLTCAFIAGEEAHGSIERMSELSDELHYSKWAEWDDQINRWGEANENLPAAERSRRPNRPEYTRLDINDKESDPYRRMGIVAFPWFARDSGTVEWGKACQGCKAFFLFNSAKLPPEEYPKRYFEKHTLYSKHQYLLHFLNCAEAVESFIDNYESKLANGVYLRTLPDSLCHIAGDPREHAYDEFSRRTPEQRIVDRAGAARSRARNIMVRRKPYRRSR